MGGALEVLRTAQLTHDAQRPDEAALIDISVAYAAGTPVWPGDVPYSCGWTARRESGSSVNLGVVTTSVHAGTHADAPLHVESAWGASESLPPQAFVGAAYVVALPVDMAPDAEISRELLASLIAPMTDAENGGFPSRLLCRTGHSVARGAFPESWPVLSADAAAWLVQSGVRLWGTDAPSVDARTSTALPVHHVLFDGGAYVLENLSLHAVAPGRYELLAQPVSLHGADAAPVRALLRAIV